MADDPAVAPAAPAAPATPAAPVVPNDQPWHQGLDTSLSGYLQNRGWDKLAAKDAAIAAARAHHEAEKLIGVPPEQIIRVPKDANDAEGWSRAYQRLGVPADAKEYDFGGVKGADGQPANEAVVTGVRAMSGEQHLTKDQATAVARFIVQQSDATNAREAAEYAEKLTAEKRTLDANWGANKTANTITAQNAATKLGVSKEELSALEKVVGYSRVMEMFRNVGARIGEDKFITGSGSDGNGQVATKEAAQARLEMLQIDQDWMERFNKGGMKERQEFDNLTRMVAGV